MNDQLKELHNYRFSMFFSIGIDIWSLGGNVYGHPRFEPGEYIHVCNPVHFDEDKQILTVCNGSRYLLVNPVGNKDSIIAEIRQAIEKGYEVH